MRFVVLAIVAALAAVIMASNAAATGAPKVALCHVPPGNPDNAHTIRVGAPAAFHHLKNHEGDYLGPCQEEDDDDDDDDNGNGDYPEPEEPTGDADRVGYCIGGRYFDGLSGQFPEEYIAPNNGGGPCPPVETKDDLPTKPIPGIPSVSWCGREFTDLETLFEFFNYGPKKQAKLLNRYPGLLKIA